MIVARRALAGRAVAITLGDDVFFKTVPAPNDVDSLALLGHEAFHRVQMEYVGMDVWYATYAEDFAGQGFNYDAIYSEIQAYAMEDTINQALGANGAQPVFGAGFFGQVVGGAATPQQAAQLRQMYLTNLQAEYNARRVNTFYDPAQLQLI